MPYAVKKVNPDKKGRAWAIYNRNTGRVIARSSTKRRAQVSASFRNRRHR